jgi:hypothetical protein
LSTIIAALSESLTGHLVFVLGAMEALVEVQLLGGYAGLANAHGHRCDVPLPCAALALVRNERGDGNPQGLAHAARRALRPEDDRAKPPPAGAEPLGVLDRIEVGDQLVAQLRGAIGEVVAPGRTSEKGEGWVRGHE